MLVKCGPCNIRDILNMYTKNYSLFIRNTGGLCFRCYVWQPVGTGVLYL